MSQLTKIFTPVKINKLELSNRLAVAPIVTLFPDENGCSTQQYIDYLEARAKGGWGLIITENHAVSPEGRAYFKLVGMWNDQQVESHKRLTEAIHKYPTKIFAQIYHCGGRTTSKSNGGYESVMPSSILIYDEMSRELSTKELRTLVGKYGDAALRAKTAGFDGIEMHSTIYYLIGQLLSPHFNKRTDEYGGSLTNRMRFLLQVIADIREKVGRDYPFVIRMHGDEMLPGRQGLLETKVICQALEDASIDAIHIKDGFVCTPEARIHLGVAAGTVPIGFNVAITAELKKSVSIPFIACGRINNPQLAETVLNTDSADIVAMARASISDPEFPNKAKAGDFEGIRECVGCMACVKKINLGLPCECTVNPALGHEGEDIYKKASKPRSVLVAGAGPGGLEAARVAAMRGHSVKIYEKSPRIGGALLAGSYPPFKGEIVSFFAWERHELEKLGVPIQTETEVTPELVKKENPDAVIVATGGKPTIPPVPGVDRPHVVLAQDILFGKKLPGQRCLVAGGGDIGFETAAFLAATLWRDVTIVEMLPALAPEHDPSSRDYFLSLYEKWNVKQLVNTKLVEIGEKTVVLEGKNGPYVYETDTVVLALGTKADSSLADALKDIARKTVVIGDAAQAREAVDATREGFNAGLDV